VWGNAVDTPAWAYLGKLDTVISTIEAKAQVCKEAASSAFLLRMTIEGSPFCVTFRSASPPAL